MLSTMRDKNRQRLEKAGAVLFALIVWQIASLMLGQELLLVSPIKVVQRLLSLCAVPDFWDSIGFSFVRIMEGFFTALLAGTVLAVAAGRFHLVDVLLWPFMAAIKATPVASFIILCLVWLNSASLSVFIAFLMVLPIIYTNMLEGITNTDKKLLEMADVFHIGLFRRIHYIYLPQLMPYFLAACSVSLGLAWKSGIAAEVIGIPDGSIGEKLYKAKLYLNSTDLFAWTVAIVVVSIVVEKLFLMIIRRIYRRLEAS
ncbi:ABC transporter permease subunit [Lachnotalea sp. AF33-28]|jgi:NitT/TauT family transport system permease protein|nr:ABC transporter permease subunit [Lachnotalea sp. AF33-28]